MPFRLFCRAQIGCCALLCLAAPSGALCASASGRSQAGTVTRVVLTGAELAAPQRANFALKLRNYGELRARVGRGEVISLAELTDRYFPRREAWARVAAWATEHGFTVQPEDPTHMTVFARAPVGTVQQVLRLEYVRMIGTDGREVTSTAGRPVIPPELADCVSGICDLRPHLKARPRQSAPLTVTSAGGAYLAPQALRQAYGITSPGMDGSGQTIVILEDDAVNPADLTAFWTQSGLPTTLAQFTELDPEGPSANDGIAEATMDIEAASSMAPKANILYVTGGFGSSVVTLLLNRLATDPTIHQISMSAGLSESFYTSFEPGESQYYAVLAAAGITFFASSGDDGSGPSTVAIGGSYDPTATPSVDYPASDPYVTGVGGTAVELAQQGSAYALPITEGGWTLPDPPITQPGGPNAGFAASGGGTSALYPRPSWQQGPNVPEGSMRCVPDVAAMAAGDPAFFIYYNGRPGGGGGTSLSSPLWAGLCAVINQGRSNAGLAPLGLLGPHIYPLMGTAAFNQITSGSTGSGAFTPTANNGAYGVGKDYNLVTGLGSPNMGQLIAALTSGASAGQPPSITAQPASLTVDAGGGATFSVAATGSSPLAYQWYFNSIRSLSPGDTSSNDDLGAPLAGATSANYTLPSAARANAGWYTVTVTNGAGIVFSSAATLTVNYAPIITGQPADVTVSQGLPAVLTVTAEAVPAPSYQWSLNGAAIAGANSATYLVKTATPSAAGTYTVTVTNSQGSSTSQPAVLTVQTSLSTQAYQFSTLAGNATAFSAFSGNEDGTGSAALFESPRGIAADSAGNVYVSDSGQMNHPIIAAEAVRLVTPAGVVTTIAGTSGQAGAEDGPGTTATFDEPLGLAVDTAGNVYVADSNNDTVRKISASGVVSTLAGSPGIAGRADGTGSAARFSGPTGVAVDAGGNVYVADNQSELIRRITPEGVVTTIAGGGYVSIEQDGTGTAARFETPYGIAVDPAGNVYVSDMQACTIRKIDPTGLVTTLAGTAGNVGSADGTGPAASFSYPAGIAADAAGNVYVADEGNSTIRKVTPAGVVTTIGGLAGKEGSADGTGSAASFYIPYDVAVDGAGNLYVADSFTGIVRKGTFVATVAITSQPSPSTETAAGTSFTVAAAGTPAPTYQWEASTDGGATWTKLSDGGGITGSTTATLSIGAAAMVSTGEQFEVSVTNVTGTVTSTPAVLTVAPSPSLRLVNISTRAQVGTGADLLIPGFVIAGSGAETLLIRADGPTLQQFGVPGVLAQPSLSVFNSAGTAIAANTGWSTNSNPAFIASTAASVGAFQVASGSADCALIVTLPAGAYTVQVSGAGNTTGVALAEIYEVSSTGTRLINVSTRTQVGTGGNILIPGFVIGGSGTEQLLVRADGPSLVQFGVTGVLARPSLSVFNGAGTSLATNTGWGASSNPSLIESTASAVGAFPFASGSADSAQLVNLAPGAYTMQVSGAGGTTGVSLAEVYVVPAN